MGSKISPELVERCVQLVRDLADGKIRTADYGASVSRAREIVADLLEPVDPDLIEARRMAARAHPEVASTNFIKGRSDAGCGVQYRLEGIKRGRELQKTEASK